MLNPIPLLSGVFASFILATVAFLGQLDPSSTTDPATLITGASASVSAGALVYVVRQIATGKLVHRDPAIAESANRQLAEEAHNRERIQQQLIESLIEKQKE